MIGVLAILVFALFVPLKGLAKLASQCTLGLFALVNLTLVNLALIRIKTSETSAPPVGVLICPLSIPFAGLIASASAETSAVLVAGAAGLVAGAMSMAAGEYVSVSSQSDTEQADLARERAELETQPDAELVELTEIYAKRGLPYGRNWRARRDGDLIEVCLSGHIFRRP